VPVGLLGGAVEALEGRRAWLSEPQIDRLRRAERRYHRYTDRRPEGAPAAAAAALLTLVTGRLAAVAAGLPWAIAQLDLLSKRMRRDARRASAGRLVPAARRRAERRQQRDVVAAGAWYRRRGSGRAELLDDCLEHLVAGLLGRRGHGEASAGWRGFEDRLRAVGHLPTPEQLADAKRRESAGRHPTAYELAGFRWRGFDFPHLDADRLPQLGDALAAVGVPTTTEQLRCGLRDRLLLAGAPSTEIESPRPERRAPVAFDPTQPQLTERDRRGLTERPWVGRKRARDRTAAVVCA